MTNAAQNQKIGLAVATIVGMNAMIGAGIFSVPAALASEVGPAGILTYAFVIIAVWCMGSSIARLAQLYPKEGSFYVYAKQWGGHSLGLIAAGSYLLGLVIAMGLLAQVAGTYLASYMQYLNSTTYLQGFVPQLSNQAWGIIILFFLTFLNMLGVVLSEAGQMILICTTVFPLITTTALCFSKADLNNLFPFMPFGLTNIFAATKKVIFGFFGFECAASLFTIVKNPEKNVSRALTLAIILVGSLYLLFVTSLILSIPLNEFSMDIALPDTLRIRFPDNLWLIIGIHLSILSAILGTIHSMIWSAGALLVSYCKKLKSKRIQIALQKEILNQRIAVFIIGACIVISCITLKNIDLFFSFTAAFIVFAFIASIITLLTLKKEWQSGENIRTLIGLVTAFVIMYFAIEGIIYNLFI